MTDPALAKQINRAILAKSETTSTSPKDELGLSKELKLESSVGEKVAVPSHAMMGTNPVHDFGKYGFILALFLAVVGAIWHYADTVLSVKSLGEDVKILRQKFDDQLRISIGTEARISVLERDEARQSATLKRGK